MVVIDMVTAYERYHGSLKGGKRGIIISELGDLGGCHRILHCELRVAE